MIRIDKLWQMPDVIKTLLSVRGVEQQGFEGLLWGQRICDPGLLYLRAQGQRQGEMLPRTCSESPNGLEMQPRTILFSASQNPEGKNGTPLKAAPKALPKERTSTVELTWGYSVGAVISALNVLTNVLATLMGKDP